MSAHRWKESQWAGGACGCSSLPWNTPWVRPPQARNARNSMQGAGRKATALSCPWVLLSLSLGSPVPRLRVLLPEKGEVCTEGLGKLAPSCSTPVTVPSAHFCSSFSPPCSSSAGLRSLLRVLSAPQSPQRQSGNCSLFPVGDWRTPGLYVHHGGSCNVTVTRMGVERKGWCLRERTWASALASCSPPAMSTPPSSRGSTHGTLCRRRSGRLPVPGCAFVLAPEPQTHLLL